MSNEKYEKSYEQMTDFLHTTAGRVTVWVLIIALVGYFAATALFDLFS